MGFSETLIIQRAVRAHPTACPKGDPTHAAFENIRCEARFGESRGIWHELVELRPIERVADSGGLPIAHRGYFDSHLHLGWLGESRTSLRLDEASSFASLLAAVETHLQSRPTGLVSGHGWDEARLGLSLDDLARAFEREMPQDREILLLRVCGHSALASRALRRRFGFERAGAWLSDRPLFEIYERLPKPTKDERAQQLIAGQNELLALGVTGVGDMSLDGVTVAALTDLAESGGLALDVIGVIDGGRVPALEERGPLRLEGSRRSHYLGRAPTLDFSYYKKYLDGSFGSRTAWLTRPYEDAETFGESLLALNDALRLSVGAVERGFCLSFHAIGDAALDQALAIGRAVEKYSLDGRRHRIEHAQLAREDQVRELARQNIWTLHIQPGHAVADRHFSAARLGPDRVAREAYRLRSFVDAGLPVALGSDAPIDDHRPESILRAACEGLEPGERLNHDAAVWFLTVRPRLIEGIAVLDPAPGAWVCLTPNS